MTVKQIYEWAKANHVENAQVRVPYKGDWSDGVWADPRVKCKRTEMPSGEIRFTVEVWIGTKDYQN
jgi:hypothetical protein